MILAEQKKKCIRRTIGGKEQFTINPSTETEGTEEKIGRRKEERTTRWKQKHDRYYRALQKNEDIDKEVSSRWLRTAGLFSKTEGFMMVIQDQVVATKNHRKTVMKDEGIEDKCRRCGSTGETIQHIINGCPQLVLKKYMKRHDDAGRILRLEMKNRINVGR